MVWFHKLIFLHKKRQKNYLLAMIMENWWSHGIVLHLAFLHTIKTKITSPVWSKVYSVFYTPYQLDELKLLNHGLVTLKEM